jgi:hypothetical protein
MSYKNRALKLNPFARFAGPVEIDSVAPETDRRFLDADRPVTTDWFNKFSALKNVLSVRTVTRLRNPQSASDLTAKESTAVPTPLRAFKKLHSLVMKRCCAGGSSSHRAAGLWLAPALPLTAERAVSAIGFRRGNEELKRGEKIGQNGNA